MVSILFILSFVFLSKDAISKSTGEPEIIEGLVSSLSLDVLNKSSESRYTKSEEDTEIETTLATITTSDLTESYESNITNNSEDQSSGFNLNILDTMAVTLKPVHKRSAQNTGSHEEDATETSSKAPDDRSDSLLAESILMNPRFILHRIIRQIENGAFMENEGEKVEEDPASYSSLGYETFENHNGEQEDQSTSESIEESAVEPDSTENAELFREGREIGKNEDLDAAEYRNKMAYPFWYRGEYVGERYRSPRQSDFHHDFLRIPVFPGR